MTRGRPPVKGVVAMLIDLLACINLAVLGWVLYGENERKRR